jgi:outer membrane protein OmpA-like peptidoglycan-associated protein
MRARVATDPDGSFRTTAVPVGPAQLEIAATNFEPAVVQTVIVAGREAPLTVTLTPKAQKAKVTGKLTNESGRAITGTLRFTGAQNLEVKTDDNGAFSAPLASGNYVVRIEAERHLAKELKLAVADGKDQELAATVRSKPVVARVAIRGGRLTIRGVSFKGAEAAIPPASAAVLDELVDALVTHPEIKRVRIEAHWDSSLPKDRAQQLTDQQARAVAAYLTAAGVAEDRIQVAGMGADKPIFPNIGMAKLRNRRVEIRVVN